MIKLESNWVPCISKCGNFEGYFKTNNIHPDFVEKGKIFISKKEFKEHYFLVEDYCDLAWDRTMEYFTKKHSPLECQFEPVSFSRDEINNFVANSLINDVNQTIMHLGEEYIDWSHLSSLASVLENFVIAANDDYTIDDALAYWGLPTLEELENKYGAEDLRYTKNTNNETHAHSFKLKF